ncbi:Uncharacterised protein [Mycobacterium tuberculosis]|uniref:Uncharacterized protein n=1 Tax=Mycobacterium tuberculosis TaxID=1773 RepID=A0A0T7LMK4_MYCTX|nr:Uncharacterised protein [Mycobacterium tuberculosis]CFE85495.1 Uncharacterised protein [Mycobacterium tuberculosis]CFR70382.1 Uncharacterised protein [Mycobacterium tuberculosis]CFR88728.1 Uncharacterised protein [Mycobacterium tuberculosis]CFS10891.1 Uncharacterised protein [Mycobacterium tuberculosis]
MTTIALKNGPEPTASVRAAVYLPSKTATSANSFLRFTSSSLTVRNWASTWLRLGLSVIRPDTWADASDTLVSRMRSAWLRCLNAASSVLAFTSSPLTCSLRSPSTRAILLAFASSCSICSPRRPTVSENALTPSRAALRCGAV